MVNESFHVPPEKTHLIESKCVNQAYQIQVMQPLMKTGANERFPVVYVTDGNLAFDFAKSISHAQQSTGDLQRFILVGIGYPGDNPFAGDILRCRDFTPASRPEFSGLPRSSPIAGVPGIPAGQSGWGSAGAFLAFIQTELAPFIDSTYPTVAADRTFFGHSLGGALGLHALFAKPGLFNRYLISSPAISYDGDQFCLREAQAYIATAKPLGATVFLSVGDQEEFEPAFEKGQAVSHFFLLAQLLRKARIPGLDLRTHVFSGETHLSVWPLAFSHGMQSLFGPAASAPTG